MGGMSRTTRIITWRRRRSSRAGHPGRLIVQIALLLSVILLITGIFVAASTVSAAVTTYRFLTRTLPDFTELERLGQDVDTTFETTKIYAQERGPDGQLRQVLIYEVIDPLGGDREWISLQQMPQSIIDATVASEDKTFWTNRGFDTEGIARAFYEYVWLGGAVQGGSSITQQLVKNHLIDEERRIVGADVDFGDYQRKIEEVLLAQKIANEYTKEQILEWYLNSNFYGNLAYGIEAAARVYYDKPAAELTLAEAAMLAAIPQSPAMNPIDNPEAAKLRQELVLDAMFRDGYIDRDQLVEAKFAPLEVTPSIEERFDIIAPHFALYVRQELERMFGPEQVLRGGLSVYTTLDLSLQGQAECVARTHIGRLSGKPDDELPAAKAQDCPALEYLRPLATGDSGVDHQVGNVAVVALDPRTGEIKAMLGSLDYWNEAIDGSFNVAVDGYRQPGSSFKPFTYVTALSQGFNAATMLLDVETDFGTPYNGVAYVPQNYDRRFHGPMRMRTALANSYNVPAVEVMSWVGVDNVIRTAHRMGITSLNAGPNSYGLSLTLGGGEVSLIDMVYAFSVFDNMGTMIGRPRSEDVQRLGHRVLDPVAILRVEDRHGEVIYEYSQPQRQEVLTPQLAFLMNDILSDTGARCPAFGCPNALEMPDGRPAAAKTGTTNDYRDGWTVGYTPQLVTGVWVGNTDNSPMDEIAGSRGAAPIWQAIMAWAHKDLPVEVWPQPPGLTEMAVCDPSGQLPNGLCPTVREYFVAGMEPTLIDNMYQEFQINRETGLLATGDTPPELIETRVFRVYPERAADWVRENEIEQPPAGFDPVTAGEGANAVISQPQPLAFVSGQVEIVGNVTAAGATSYRLEVFAGLTGDNPQLLVERAVETAGDGVLGSWDTGSLNGLYTLRLTVNREGGGAEVVNVPVTVDNTPPAARILFPFDEQSFRAADEWIVIQAQAEDDNSLEQVSFFVDGSETPFAISTVPPFSEVWAIPGAGCRSFYIVARDAAGNETRSDAVRVCVDGE